MPGKDETRSAFHSRIGGKGKSPADTGTDAGTTSEKDAVNVSRDLRRSKVGDSRKPATWRVERELLEDFIQYCQVRGWAQNLTLEEFIRRGMREVE